MSRLRPAFIMCMRSLLPRIAAASVVAALTVVMSLTPLPIAAAQENPMAPLLTPSEPAAATLKAEAVVVIEVRSGTVGGAVPEGLAVELVTIQPPHEHRRHDARTDAAGRARIPVSGTYAPATAGGQPELPTLTGMASVWHDGLVFHSERFEIELAPADRPAPLVAPIVTALVKIYEKTTSREALAVSQHLIGLEPSPAEPPRTRPGGPPAKPAGNRLAVAEIIFIDNRGDRAIVSDDPARPLVTDLAPAGAEGLKVQQAGRGDYDAASGEVREFGPILPGGSELIYDYYLPAGGWPVRISKKLAMATPRFSVVTGTAALDIRGAFLPPRYEASPDRQSEFLRRDLADQPAAGATVEIEVRPAPPPKQLPHWSYLALAAIAAVSVLLLAWRRSDRGLEA